MPVRIYDISKKLGLENKEVLAKAKELGIVARVASSSLDKITAEYLEDRLKEAHPEITAPRPPPPPALAPSPPPAEPVSATPAVVAVTAPPPEIPAGPTADQVLVEAKAPTEQPPPPTAVVVPDTAPAVSELPKAPEPEPAVPVTPPPPAPPPSPKVGDKVGFIQLPTRPGPRLGDKAGSAKLPARPGETRRAEFTKRGGLRTMRGATTPPGASALPGARFGGQKKPGAGGRPAEAPSAPKIVLPANATVITVKPPIVVRELADQLKQKPFKIIADLMESGVFASVNQAIDETVAQKICAKYGFRFEVEKRERGSGLVHAPKREVELDVEDKIEDLVPRPPVVTIMGHVDHGKTSLLDVIRKSNVAAGEAGGITQHIGAYTISFPHPERKKELAQITFLDTPGHAAFSSMRARGANVTDLVVLVVAANDGVMPQTLEALSHARAARVPLLVAVNKIDHPNANSLKVRQQLQDKGLVPDDWGGDTIFVDVSALTKQGVDKLIEMILLQADLLELKANPDRRAKGNVIESGLEPGGPTATVLVRKGTLRVSEVIICGPFYGRVRALISEEGKRLKEAGPCLLYTSRCV